MPKRNPERDAEIIRLRKTTRMSMREIGLEVGATKNVVVGVVNRAYGKELPAGDKRTPWTI